MSELSGKSAVVLGVANEDSIAWHIARKLKGAGAAIHLGYQPRFRSRVQQLLQGADVAPDSVNKCDVTDDGQLGEFFAALPGPVDVLVHSIGYAPLETFGKPIQEVTPTEFAQALQISSYSLLRLCQLAQPRMAPQASVITLTYLGSQRVVPGYRLMGVAKAALESIVRELAVELGPRGVRVNAISAGPIRTLAAQAIPAFDQLIERYEQITPLRARVEASDVADAAAFLAGPASRRITGQILYVDSGYSILGTSTPAGT